MGRPLPADIRAELQADADAYPISKERLASWSEWDGYAITRKTPEGEWLETFAPPGHPDPFNHRWFAEVDLGRERDGREWRFVGSTRRAFPKPLIAAVNGHAHAGGFEIMLACDLVVAAEHATFGNPEVQPGLAAGAGGSCGR